MQCPVIAYLAHDRCETSSQEKSLTYKYAKSWERVGRTLERLGKRISRHEGRIKTWSRCLSPHSSTSKHKAAYCEGGKRAKINACALIVSMSQAECNQIWEGTAGILKSFYFSLFMGAKISLAPIYCSDAGCSSLPWHSLILHMELSSLLSLLQKCFLNKLAFLKSH